MFSMTNHTESLPMLLVSHFSRIAQDLGFGVSRLKTIALSLNFFKIGKQTFEHNSPRTSF